MPDNLSQRGNPSQTDQNYPTQQQQQQQQQQPNPETSRGLAALLLTKCNTILTEISTFQSLLSQKLRNPQLIEIRSLRSSIVSELRTVEKLSDKIEAAFAAAEQKGDAGDDVEARYIHALRSSNLPFYEAVWGIAKGSCGGLAGFGKRFYWGDGVGDGEDGKKLPNKDKRKSVLVDIVADDGEEWVKVSTISESRLLFEMAEKGWEKESEPGSDDEDEGKGRTVLRNYEIENEDDDDEVGLIKLAMDMRRAANATRVRYRRPQIRFVLPRIEEQKSSDIDDLIDTIRGYGITVECGGRYTEVLDSQTAENSLSHLLPSHFIRFTPSLNVDCTLLLAMVSDLSHYKSVHPSPEYHTAINRQIEIEREHPLLPVEIWPATVDREMLCTDEAGKRMREIVDTIGTDTEKKRTDILMGVSPFDSLDPDTLVQKFQELSDYEVPAQWRLPVKTVEARPVIDSGRKQARFPPIVDNVAEMLSDINYSVFLYGWVTGLVTISSNRTVVRQIETTVENHRNGDEDLVGPTVWVCDTPRSLIGKEKDRRE
ncbi:uncharacterized protein EURHEDRAFT_458707 [Aspergillus ruber CBS 135680]|uniref:DUF1308 domain-containing protein n=1 Tax=Aspergillus ruber (strain CBS 135680) TaxID=1388766 RepID=A0A017SB05_ASPRC|nr:uncharacterized protein EURHEDRAFT_458707 [Aspergillus ruber CBS 135680]EYE94092.1 hypothetical protein EURHEDRAFT_458707 [Aspergillus ruber CBS 135680]